MQVSGHLLELEVSFVSGSSYISLCSTNGPTPPFSSGWLQTLEGYDIGTLGSGGITLGSWGAQNDNRALLVCGKSCLVTRLICNQPTDHRRSLEAPPAPKVRYSYRAPRGGRLHGAYMRLLDIWGIKICIYRQPFRCWAVHQPASPTYCTISTTPSSVRATHQALPRGLSLALCHGLLR